VKQVGLNNSAQMKNYVLIANFKKIYLNLKKYLQSVVDHNDRNSMARLRTCNQLSSA
jgi:hypothetical protein